MLQEALKEALKHVLIIIAIAMVTIVSMPIEKAYEKFYKILEQIDNSDIPPCEQHEFYQEIESEIGQKRQQAYADMHEC